MKKVAERVAVTKSDVAYVKSLQVIHTDMLWPARNLARGPLGQIQERDNLAENERKNLNVNKFKTHSPV